MNKEEKPIIIFDTDMDTDCDDVGALAMLLEAHNMGKVELYGVIADSVSKFAAPCCEAVLAQYNISVPIGTIYSHDYMEKQSDIDRFSHYRAHTAKCASHGKDYNRVFAQMLEKRDIDYPSSVHVYRTLLAKAKDNSITVLCVGMLTAVAETLCTGPDEISPLSGKELFAKKVKTVITMGNHEKVFDFNWGMDAIATKLFFELCPVPIYISSQGDSVITGAHLSKFLPEAHLLRKAYSIYLGKENCGRSSWDLIATLFAIHPSTPYLTARDLGDCIYDAQSKTTAVTKTEHPQCKTLHLTCSDTDAASILDDYMLGKI